MLNSQQIAGTKLSQIPQHTYLQFGSQCEQPIYFNSKFDSANLKKVIKTSHDSYSIWTASDAEGTPCQGYPKSWFYFQTGGFRKKKITFSIHRVHFLWSMTCQKDLYRPVYRIKQISDEGNVEITKWQRLPYPILSLSVNNQEELVLKFDFYFPHNIKSVQFAFIYPYSHVECRTDMLLLNDQYQKDNEIFLKQYQLCQSYEGRTVDLLVISSHEGKQGYENIKTQETFTLGGNKLVKFRNNKPIIFVSARVHPIETPSSFVMKGIIKYLLNKKDYRAHLLRKYFVFILVPMLNPDGVSNGNCRMDSLNQNLNRFYKNPDPIKQPSCYSVKKLCEHFNKDKRLFMYLDLHAHPAYKGNFMFGNAIFDYIDQVQSHFFPKIISQNCINFQFEQCIFSRKHMTAKDKNQDMNKQGCGRVVFYKEFGLTHSYTLECGYHCNLQNNVLQPQGNTNKSYIVRYKTNQKGQNIYDNFQQQIIQQNQQVVDQLLVQLQQKKGNKNIKYSLMKYGGDYMDNINEQYYKTTPVIFIEDTYQNLGRNICISILDIWNKNPYSRITNGNQHRKQIAQKHAKLDRFRREQAGIKTKQKKIIELIETQIYGEWHKRNIFQSFNAMQEAKKSSSMYRKTEKQKMMERQETVIHSNSKMFAKGNSRVKMVSIKQQRRFGIINPHIQTSKTMTAFEQSFSILAGKLGGLQKNNTFKPLMNVRIRNIGVSNR